MSYKIVLYRNGKKDKNIFKSDKLNGIKIKYINMVKHNEVMIPKRLVNNEKLKPVNYELILMESKDVSKGEIVVRDYMGKIIRDREIEPGWLVLERSNYKVEETFTVFGRNKRMTCIEIVKELLLPNKLPKQVYCLLNKLVIEDDNDHMEIITCKNEYESGRLHDVLRDVCRKFEVQSIIFFGRANYETRSRIYPKILKFTGWKGNRVYRRTTRP
jgi:hypothetical protein